jgi:hypothetical protein
VFERETLPDGSTRLTSPRGSFTFARLRAGSFLVSIAGYDDGDFGDAPFEAMQAEIARFRRIELFVDVSAVFGAATSVRESWTDWLRTHHASLSKVHILSGSKFVLLTLSVAKELSRTGDLIRIYSDAQAFAASVAQSRAAK